MFEQEPASTGRKKINGSSSPPPNPESNATQPPLSAARVAVQQRLHKPHVHLRCNGRAADGADRLPGLPVAQRRGGTAREEGVHAERLRRVPLRAPLHQPPGDHGRGGCASSGSRHRRCCRHRLGSGTAAAEASPRRPAAGPRRPRHKNPGLHRRRGRQDDDAGRRRGRVPGAEEEDHVAAEPRLAALHQDFPGSLIHPSAPSLPVSVLSSCTSTASAVTCKKTQTATCIEVINH